MLWQYFVRHARARRRRERAARINLRPRSHDECDGLPYVAVGTAMSRPVECCTFPTISSPFEALFRHTARRQRLRLVRRGVLRRER